MKNRCLYVLLCLLLCGGFSRLSAQNNVIDEVVWVVGDEAILKSDVESERADAQYEGRKIDGDPYCVIPEQLAIEKLFLHQAELDSVEVTDQEVMQYLEYQLSYLVENIGTKEKLEEYFNRSYTEIREMLREKIRNKQIVDKMQKQLVGDIKVVPAEVRRYFKDLPSDSIPFVPTQVEVQIITMEPAIPQEEIDRVKQTLRDYTERVNKGEIAFSTLARMYSEDVASARKGGEIGFNGKGELASEYANVAFNLQDPNKVSKIVETEFGFHIIQLIEKRGDRINTRHILMRPRVDDSALQTALVKLDSIGKQIRSGELVFDDAASFMSQDKDTRNNHGLMVNAATGTSRFEMQDLAQVSLAVAKTIEQMNVGEVSQAFTMTNSKGREICAIVKLKNRINGHKATITEDYQRLKNIVVQRRSEEKLKKWIVEKQKHTYVRINENWNKCEFKYPGWVIVGAEK
ncbi:MAG: peptidylprolyl isomerase [Bacteroidales bacterium]|nr:peptidylprolyl isomerase [Bacteroidales bacterium]